MLSISLDVVDTVRITLFDNVICCHAPGCDTRSRHPLVQVIIHRDFAIPSLTDETCHLDEDCASLDYPPTWALIL